jgi:hypothetical protein
MAGSTLIAELGGGSPGGELSARMGFQISLGGDDCGSGISRRRAIALIDKP